MKNQSQQSKEKGKVAKDLIHKIFLINEMQYKKKHTEKRTHIQESLYYYSDHAEDWTKVERNVNIKLPVLHLNENEQVL